MAKKVVCEQCGHHSIVMTAENEQAIRNEQAKYILQGKKRSIEQIVNRMITEWRVDRNVEDILYAPDYKPKADDGNNKQAENPKSESRKKK